MNCLKYKKILFSLLLSLSVSFLFLATAFADNTISQDMNQIENAVGNQTARIWGVLKAIVGPCGGIVFAWNGIKMLFGGEREMEESKKRFLIIIIVFICIYGAGVIIGEIGAWNSSAIPSVTFDSVLPES